MNAERTREISTPSLRHGAQRPDTQPHKVRSYNERLLLSLLREHGRLASADLARRSGLTAQTASTITRRLQRDGLLAREAPVRGRVGQPSVPLALAPDGAFFLGLHYGRRSGELVLLDFTGRPRAVRRSRFAFPTGAHLRQFAREALAALIAALEPGQRGRIAGMGVAMPFRLWEWEQEAGLAPGTLAPWIDFDIATSLTGLCSWPVQFCNDANAACAAELVFGNPARHANFVYFFIASLVGGGVVIDGALREGRTGLGGSFASMPVPARTAMPADKAGAPGADAVPLIHRASLYRLEAALARAGHDPSLLWRRSADWSDFEPMIGLWIEDAAPALAHAALAAASVIETEAIVIDGAFPAPVRARLTERVRTYFAALDRRGLPEIAIVEGTQGAAARALGAAALPLIAQFSGDRFSGGRGAGDRVSGDRSSRTRIAAA